MAEHKVGNYNPHDSKGRFTSGRQYSDIEPNKDRQIKENERQAVDKNTDGIENPLPLASKLDIMQVESLLKNSTIAYNGPLQEVDISTLKTIQPKLFTSGHETYDDPKDDAPVVINLQGRTNVVVDGNHRIYQAIQNGKKTIKVHYTKHTDYM